MRLLSSLCLCSALACNPSTPAPEDTDTTDTEVVQEALNVWYIDDEEHPALYASLNCEMNDAKLRLSAADSGGVGSIQMVLGERPTAAATLTIVNPADLSAIAPGEIYLSIGRDRESANQYEATSGTVSVEVVTTDPQEINLSFADLPSTTSGGATAALSGDVGARDGSFFGACDFEDL